MDVRRDEAARGELFQICVRTSELVGK